MIAATFLFRTFCHLLCPLLLVVIFSGGVGGTPLWEYGASGAVPLSPQAAAVTTLPVRSEPVVTGLVAVSPSTVGRPSLPRLSRPSRFTLPADRSYRSRTITEDTTWSGQVLIEGVLTVASRATLVINPGATIRFRPTPEGVAGFLLIRGRILATGTADQPITFTSDEINPTAGDWQGIMFLDSSKKNLLEWCRVESADVGVAAEFSELLLRQSSLFRCRTGVALRSSTAVVTGGTVSECLTGFFTRDGDSDLSGGIFSGNGRGIVMKGGSLFLSEAQVTGSTENGLEATGGRVHLEANRFVRNGAGVILTGCRGDLVGSRIQENRMTGLELADSPLRITGNRISGNGGVGVVVRSGGGTLWENILEGNKGGELDVTGSGEVVAPANWWGSADSARIRERIRENSGGKILFTPQLESPPQLP